MKRALAAGLLSSALAAYAQAPPEPPAPPSSQAAPAAAPSPEPPVVSPAEVPQPTPAVVTQEQAEQPAPHPPPAPVRARVARPQTSQPQPQPQPPAVLPHPPAERDQLIAELRQQVNRLQSELDAERAAALQPAQEPAAQQRNGWGWLVIVALLALTGGFLLGWRLLDRRIRRKYGGLRIY